MTVDANQLKTFYWIARLGSFRAAAKRLNVSQPTVSLRIKAWEADLGCRLFERRGRSVHLTEDGAAALNYAERILSLLEDLERRVGNGNELKGQIRLGVPDSFARVCLPRLLSRLDREQPALKVAVTITNSAVLSRRLDDGALDLAVLSEPGKLQNVRLTELGRHRLVWVARAGLLPDKCYRPSDLADVRIFTNPSPSPSFQLIMDWFSEHGVVPTRLSTCDSFSVVISLVQSGVGVSALPRSIVHPEIEKGTLVTLAASPDLPAPRIFIGIERSSRNAAVPVLEEAVSRVTVETPFLDAESH